MNIAKRPWRAPSITLLDSPQASSGAGVSAEQFCTPGGPFGSGFGGMLSYCSMNSHHRVYSHFETAHRAVTRGCEAPHDSKSANACLAGS